MCYEYFSRCRKCGLRTLIDKTVCKPGTNHGHESRDFYSWTECVPCSIEEAITTPAREQEGSNGDEKTKDKRKGSTSHEQTFGQMVSEYLSAMSKPSLR